MKITLHDPPEGFEAEAELYESKISSDVYRIKLVPKSDVRWLMNRISYLESQLAEAKEEITQHDLWRERAYRTEAEARKQAFEDAAQIAENRANPYKSGGDYERERFLGMIEVAEALRRERDKTPTGHPSQTST